MATQPSFVSQPSIVRIPVLLRELLDGELLIPRFQRPSVWSPEQQLLLLDSIRRKYPIGSILVWRTRDHALAYFEEVGGLKVTRGEPGMPEYKQYVLDGHQRLSTMLRMLGPGLISAQNAADEEPEFIEGGDDAMDPNEVFFDLEEGTFVEERRKSEREKHWLPVSILLDPYKLDPFKVRLARDLGKDGRRLGQVADDLATRFKDYTLPVTPLASEDLEFVTESFRRVNSAGTAMSEVHMVHALSWTRELDLVSQLEDVQRRFTERGWDGLSSESILTTCKALVGLDPARAHPDELKKHVRENRSILPRVEKCLLSATEILSQVNVRSLKTLPYEYQLVVLAFVASRHGDELPTKLHQGLVTWFWYVTYTAYLNNLVSLRKVIQSINRNSPNDGVPIPTDADRRVLPIQRINFHTGRTRAFALQLARVGPLNPSGNKSDPGEILARHGGDALVPLLPRRLVRGRESAPENRVLIEPTRAEAIRELCLEDTSNATAAQRRRILRSHLITQAAENALTEKRYTDFLDLRREEIDRVEREFVGDLQLQFGVLR